MGLGRHGLHLLQARTSYNDHHDSTDHDHNYASIHDDEPSTHNHNPTRYNDIDCRTQGHDDFRQADHNIWP